MRITTLIEHSAELIRVVYNSPQPTDKILNEHFRAKKQYGSKERKFVVNTIYFTLRNYLLLEKLETLCSKEFEFDFKSNEWKILIGLLLSKEIPNFSRSYLPDELISKVESNETADSILESIFTNQYENFQNLILKEYKILEEIIGNISELNLSPKQIEALELRFSFPDFLFLQLQPTFKNYDELIQFLQNSIEQAPISFRINTLKSNLEEVSNEFDKLGIPFSNSELAPDCIYTNQRLQLTELNLFKSGKIEVQDEGSQLISFALNPEEREIILDACAGAGGKSLHIACLQKNNGLIIANDIEYQRLKEIPKRAHRAGISTIITHLSKYGNDNFREILSLTKEHLFDKILIDAPCSGSGTIRRDPLKKYRINPKMIEKINKNQLRILQEYSRFVRPGGYLVYSTCSILTYENERIVETFLNNNDSFKRVNILEDIDPRINTKLVMTNDYRLNIDFRNSNSDGFFMAKMQRVD